jgi:hypothetical protein
VCRGDVYCERRISSFPKGGVGRLRLHSRNKYVVNLGIYKGKVKKKVCSLHFQKEIATREGGDSSKA